VFREGVCSPLNDRWLTCRVYLSSYSSSVTFGSLSFPPVVRSQFQTIIGIIKRKKRNIESATPLLPLFPFGGGKRLKSLPGLVDGGASEAAIFVLFLFGVVAWS